MGGHVNEIWHDLWSDALKDKLSRGFSYSRIAAEINEQFNTNFSRNAACGKGYRMGLAAPKKVKPPPRQRTRSKPTITIKPIPRVEAIRIRCTEIVPRNLTLLELESGDCRYPSGDDQFVFCGHQQQADSSYCPAHEALCHAKEPRLTAEDRMLRRVRWKKLQKFMTAEAA